MQLQEAFESLSTVVVDTPGSATNGYRMVKRSGFSISEAAMTAYKNTCKLIAATMDTVFDRCDELGYNVTRDSLQVVGDVDSPTMKLIPDTLLVIMMPFMNDLFYSRYAIPGWDGNACLFRLNGAYETQGYPDMTFRAVNRSIREQKTVEFLGKPGGVWRNGWYKDPECEKWYAGVMSTENTSLGTTMRKFDMLYNTERDCFGVSLCGEMIQRSWRGAQLIANDSPLPYTSVAIMNEKHYGIFLAKAITERSVESVYDLQMILANVSLGALLYHWLVAKIAMLNSYRSGATTELQLASIGVLSYARGFRWFPILLLPRLKTNLAVFTTTGGSCEEAQTALTQAWFIMYLGVAELLFFVYSLLNLIAKLLHRRMTDALFGPTLVFSVAMRYVRIDLTQSGWFEFDGQIATVLTSEQFDWLSLLGFFRDDTLLKLNDNVKSLFLIKIGVLSLNLLPLLWSRPTALGNFAKSTTTKENLALYLISIDGLSSLPASPEPSCLKKQSATWETRNLPHCSQASSCFAWGSLSWTTPGSSPSRTGIC